MRLALLAAALSSLALAGCGADYYFQTASGQLDLIARAKPLGEVIDTTSDARLKDRLERARAIRAYASRELGLPDNGSFTRYTDVGRPFVLWNVFAAPELSLKPREWCFPVAGCVNYRGYFSEDEARAEAASLRSQGYDVHVGGVPAYSTLGWFDDPLLSSFIRYPDLELARLVFHELAHQVVYAKDDSTFNESFAVAVEEAGLARWIVSRPPAEAAKLMADRERGERLRAEFRRIVRGGKAALATTYASGADVEAKRRAKRDAFEAMRVAYVEARGAEPGLAAFDRWFAGEGGGGAEQREPGLDGAVFGQRAGLPGPPRAGRRRPAALLRPRPRAGVPAQGRAARLPGVPRRAGAGRAARAGRPPESRRRRLIRRAFPGYNRRLPCLTRCRRGGVTTGRPPRACSRAGLQALPRNHKERSACVTTKSSSSCTPTRASRCPRWSSATARW
jgi:predicted aminopeptidase